MQEYATTDMNKESLQYSISTQFKESNVLSNNLNVLNYGNSGIGQSFTKRSHTPTIQSSCCFSQCFEDLPIENKDGKVRAAIGLKNPFNDTT